MTGEEYRKLFEKSPHDARSALFDEYYRYVYTVVCNKINNAPREDIEEAVSDTFADVFYRLEEEDRFNGELKGIVAAVAKRRAIDKYRRLSVYKSHIVDKSDDDMLTVESDFDVGEDMERTEQQRKIMEQIEQLGEPDSTIIIQKFYFNRTSSEIAKALSMKPSAVRMRQSRALKRLKSVFAELGFSM